MAYVLSMRYSWCPGIGILDNCEPRGWCHESAESLPVLVWIRTTVLPCFNSQRSLAIGCGRKMMLGGHLRSYPGPRPRSSMIIRADTCNIFFSLVFYSWKTLLLKSAEEHRQKRHVSFNIIWALKGKLTPKFNLFPIPFGSISELGLHQF